MKRLLSFLFLFVIIFSANAQEQKQEEKKGPVIKFKEASHDFGDITQGDKVQYVFEFENSGSEPLVLSEVVTTCGCTAPDWDKEPVMPGDSGQVHVTFNSAHKMGRQNKIITVISNAVNNPARVSIICNVLPK